MCILINFSQNQNFLSQFLITMVNSDILSREEWEQAVERTLRSKEFEVMSYEIRPLGSTGGYLGDHFTVDVKIRRYQSENSEKILHFFLKTEPEVEMNKNMTRNINAFKKEVDTVQILFPKLRSVLNEGGKNMIWSCNYYFIRPDVLVQEDLSKQGFRSFTLRDSLGYEHFALTMKALANIHAASIIFEEKQSTQPYRLIDVHPDIFEEALFRHAPDSNHPGTRWLDTCVKTLWLLVELIHGKDSLKRMKAELERIMLTLYDLQKPSERFRNVLCHGDVKRDNIMFRHEGDVPVEVRIVDYQFTRYAPPANDVMCFLYLSSNREFRRQHASRLLSVYYEQFAKNLTEHDLNPNELLSWEEFKESCDFYKTLGILIGAGYCPGTFISGENMQHVFMSAETDRFILDDRSVEVTHSFKTDQFYRKNITDLVEEVLEELILLKVS